MTSPSTEQIESLKRYDTPTICNAIEIVRPERRGHGFTRSHLFSIGEDNMPMVGFARTACIRAGQPAAESSESMSAMRANYYSYVADGALPKVVIMQDLDGSPGIGSFWGEVNSAVHLGLGCAGVITNGSVRDLDEFAPGFCALAGLIAPSHAYVHVANYSESVEVAGMTVHHDDLIHADKHGAVVVPKDCVAEIPAAVDLLVRREAVILAAARSPDFDIEKLKTAMSAQSDIH